VDRGRRQAYEQRATCVADQYSGYTVAATRRSTGGSRSARTRPTTAAPPRADGLSRRPGARSRSKLDGFTPEQRVFLGWAQVWCENARPRPSG
jgi:predicted metalloendopeptidase